MKKQFIRPTMDIIKIKNQNLLAGSPGLGGNWDSSKPVLGRELDEDFLEDF